MLKGYFREKRYITGNYMDIDIFALPKNKKPLPRARKIKESSPKQKTINDTNSERYFVRLVNNNFTKGDFLVDPTIAGEEPTREEALKLFKNYISRVRYFLKKIGTKEKLKYIYVISNSDREGNRVRTHLHIFVKKITGLTREKLEELWKYGRCNTDIAQPNEYGLTDRGLYCIRQTKGERTWGSSTNLDKPEPIVSDKRITPNMVRKMTQYPDDKKLFEKLNPGWTFTDCFIGTDENGTLTPRLYIRMRRTEANYSEPAKIITQEEHQLEVQQQLHIDFFNWSEIGA